MEFEPQDTSLQTESHFCSNFCNHNVKIEISEDYKFVLKWRSPDQPSETCKPSWMCFAFTNFGIPCGSKLLSPFSACDSKDKNQMILNMMNIVQISDSAMICKDHLDFFSYRSRQNQCGNPFSDHNKVYFKRCKKNEVSLDESLRALKHCGIDLNLYNYRLKAHTLLCDACYTKFISFLISSDAHNDLNTVAEVDAMTEDPVELVGDTASSNEEENSDDDYTPAEKRACSDSKVIALDVLNSALSAFDILPLPFSYLFDNKERQVSIMQNKLLRVASAIISLADNVGVVVPPMIFNSDLQEIVSNIKNRVQSSNMSFSEQKVAVSYFPHSWTVYKISQSIGVLDHIANEGKKLQFTGSYGSLQRKERSNISPDSIKEIQNFFLRSDVSRELPGMNNYVRVRVNGDWIKIQKRLLLMTYNEAFSFFKEVTTTGLSVETNEGKPKDKVPDTLDVCRTTFVKYKPKEVVPLSRNRHHNVCVCVYHENVRLLCEKVGIIDLKTLICMCVCDIDSKLCMYSRCDKCPGPSVIEEHVFKILNDKELLDSNFVVQQWVKTDSTELASLVVPGSDLPSKIAGAIQNLLKHDFITKIQNRYFQKCKKEFSGSNAVVVVDFAENFNPTYQNEIPSMHFGANKVAGQTTIHPIVMYYHDGEGTKVVSSAVFSDYLDHSQSSFHCFFKSFLTLCQEKFPQIKNFHVFSDGCAAQYKCYKAFANLAHFSKDYPGHTIKWSFFATSHGKNACDGIGGTIKRTAKDCVLRSPTTFIRNSEELFQFCASRLKTTNCIYVSAVDVEKHIVDFSLDQRYLRSRTVPGTREMHYIQPWITGLGLDMLETSEDDSFSARFEFATYSTLEVNASFCSKFVACEYDRQWYLGIVTDVNEKGEELRIEYFRRVSAKSNVFVKNKGDWCWRPFGCILKVVTLDKLANKRSDFSYKLKDSETEIDNLLLDFLKIK